MFVPLTRPFMLCLALVQPRKTKNCPHMTEKLLAGTKASKLTYNFWPENVACFMTVSATDIKIHSRLPFSQKLTL